MPDTNADDHEGQKKSVAAVPSDIPADSRIDDETPELGAPSEADDIVSDRTRRGLPWGDFLYRSCALLRLNIG